MPNPNNSLRPDSGLWRAHLPGGAFLESHSLPTATGPADLALRAGPSGRLVGLAVLVSILSGGCTLRPQGPAALPAWELANAEPGQVIPVLRTRVGIEQEIPARLTRRLSEEFTLVSIQSRTDWAELRRELQLPPLPRAMDLSRGTVIGVLAEVGEAIHPEWPIHLQAARTQAGLGSLEAVFTPGIYYPLQTAGYLELVYIPRLETVGMVQINNRTFMFPSGAVFH